MSSITRARATRRVASALMAVGSLAAAAAPAAATSFYDPPSALPAGNGELVRSEPMALGASVNFGSGRLPGSATRIMYTTTDTNGEVVAVTGTYIEPNANWKASGPRPLVTYAEGTQGQADECAPSRGLENPVGFSAGSVNVGYEIPSIYNLLSKGVAVVVTDYVGLGTTDRLHTYVNRIDQGHAVLDAARAALKLPGTSIAPSSAIGAYGYSQGGGATGSAAELAPTYAPELNLKGAVVGAPPADLAATMRKADGTSLTTVIGFALNGFLQTYPQFQPLLDANVTNAGRAALKDIAGSCIGDGIAKYAFHKTSEWTTSRKSISQIIDGLPEVKAMLETQRLGRSKPAAPVRILTGTKDDIVPHDQAKRLAYDWCRLGVNVDYKPTWQWFDTGGTALNHLSPMISTDAGDAQEWLLDRLQGYGARSNCRYLNWMP